MRKDVILGLVILLSINFVFAYNLSVGNVSIRNSYAPGEVISGNFTLNLVDVPTNAYFTSEFGNFSARDFFKANGLALSCENVNCSDLASLTNNGESSKTISLVSNEEKKYAFAITDSGVSFNQLTFNLLSDFSESTSFPLEISIGNGLVLNYNQFSDNYLRQISYGCYNSGLSSYDENSKIDQIGYCEKMDLQRSNRYLVGAHISGTALRDFKMQLKDSQGLQVLGECTILKDGSRQTSFAEDSSCVIETGNMNNGGTYYVCIKDSTAGNPDQSLFYRIKSESNGLNCGYYSNLATSSSTDYAIYAKLPSYAGAPLGGFSLSANSSNGGLSGISSYVSQNYPNGCANTCVIPFSVKGVPQRLNFSQVDLSYGSTNGPKSANKIYEISYSPRKFNFSGSLSLDAFNWSLSGFGNKSFLLNLVADETKQVLNASLNLLVLPVIEFVNPLNPPAGVPVFFYVQVKNSANINNYEWSFGDNSSVVISSVPYVLHNYQNISSYTLSVKVGEGNYSATKSFSVVSINPKDSLNESFSSKRIMLNHASNDLLSLPSWYQNGVSKIVNLDYYQNQLNQLESEKNIALTDQDFLSIATRLSQLVMPWAIIITDMRVGLIVGDYNNFSPSIVQEISPSSIQNDSSLYKSAIFEWQSKNTLTSLNKSRIRVFYENESFQDILSIYQASVRSNYDNESYFVIQSDLSQMSFSSDSSVAPKKIGKNTYLLIPPKGSVFFKFYFNGSTDPVMFISPKLSSLSLDNSVGVCNYNKRCEKNLGENSENCRNDCRPIGWMIFWLVLLVIFALVIYTILQVWYKRKYEEYLFNQRDELYNLISFIENGKLSKFSVPQMKTLLLQKGWDEDQIRYALRKSDGKNTGMFEIIPVEKIMSLFKKKTVEIPAQKKQPVAPTNPYPIKAGLQRPGFNPLRDQRQMPVNRTKTTTPFGQQVRPKY